MHSFFFFFFCIWYHEMGLSVGTFYADMSKQGCVYLRGGILIFLQHFFHITLFSCCSLCNMWLFDSFLATLCLAPFLCALFSCYTLFILHFLHIQQFSCCIFFLLHSSPVALFACCTFFLLCFFHFFY